jgi:hypothetical protein
LAIISAQGRADHPDEPAHRVLDMTDSPSPAATARQRDSLFLLAPLRLDDAATSQDVRIRNLSAGGLMAEVGRDVPVGTVATLELRGIGPVTGRVAWSEEGRIGVALDRPIDPKKARKPVGTGARTPSYAKAPARSR